MDRFCGTVGERYATVAAGNIVILVKSWSVFSFVSIKNSEINLYIAFNSEGPDF